MTTLVWLLIVGLVLWLLVVRRAAARKLRILRAQLAAYRRGNYLEQLKIIEGFRTKNSEPPYYWFFRGSACYQLGRLEEAERALRRSLAAETKPAAQLRHPAFRLASPQTHGRGARRTLCRDQLGLVLMEQECWDDAADCFRQCIAEDPNRGGGHCAMAELLLRHGEQYAVALDEARKAVAANRSRLLGSGEFEKEAHDGNLGESLAFLAWALASNSADPDEVKSTLNEAFAICGEDTKPVLARVHFCAGQACAVLGNKAESTRHFERAAEADPHGNYGRLSRAAAAGV